MGRFWYTLPIPQSVPRKLLLHNGFGLVGHLGHFETPSRENKLIQATAAVLLGFLSSGPRSCGLLHRLCIYSYLRLSTAIYT